MKAFCCNCITQIHLSGICIESKALILNAGRDAYLCTFSSKQVTIRSGFPDFTCCMDNIGPKHSGISPSSQPVSPAVFQPTSLPPVNLPKGFMCCWQAAEPKEIVPVLSSEMGHANPYQKEVSLEQQWQKKKKKSKCLCLSNSYKNVINLKHRFHKSLDGLLNTTADA